MPKRKLSASLKHQGKSESKEELSLGESKASDEEKKSEELAQKWAKKMDSTGSRFVSSLLKKHKKHDPLVNAIFKDDISLFETQYAINKGHSLLFWFEAACVCGSENLIFHFLEQYKIDISKSQDAVAYALSSGNMLLATKLAHLAKERGQKELGRAILYPFPKLSDFEKIKAIFDPEAEHIEDDSSSYHPMGR